MARRRSNGSHTMHSKAQWAFLFATHKPFARKWAERVEATRGKKVGYRTLPARLGVRKHV